LLSFTAQTSDWHFRDASRQRRYVGPDWIYATPTSSPGMTSRPTTKESRRRWMASAAASGPRRRERPRYRRAHGTGDDLKGLRDRALLLIGFAGAFRHSELVAVDCEDVEECETGLKISIRHSKTDQEGAGATIAIVCGSVACPVAALRAWRDAAGIATGAMFRSIRKGGKVGDRLSAQSVADIVKAHAQGVGLDPTLFAGHSLRAGFLPSTAKRGASIFKMMDVSRHRSVDTLCGYVRDAELFQNHGGRGSAVAAGSTEGA
jgi:integrase